MRRRPFRPMALLQVSEDYAIMESVRSIYIIGAQCTGKKTLVDDVAEELQGREVRPFFSTIKELARGILKTPTISAQHRTLEAIAHLVDNGTLKTTMTENFGIINAENLKRAHEAVESNSVRGKIVLEGF